MSSHRTLTAIFIEEPDPAESIKLNLTPAMIVDEKAGGYSGTPAGNLVDEQMVAADPRGGAGGSAATSWMPSWHQIDYPWSCYVDLGQTYNITDIYLYDHEWKNGNLSVSYGSPGNWVVLFTDGLNRNSQWFGQTVNITTRYLRFTRHATTSFVDEIVIYGTAGEPDTTAPAAITDLAATAITAGSVALSWTATGDDGANGAATLYDARYSTDPIIASNWNNANPVAAEPIPAPAGTPQSMTVFGLNPNTTYYFAIKAFDDSSNPSPLSNVALATTLPDTGPQAKTFGSFMASIYLMDMPAERIDMFRKMRMYLHTPVIAQNASGPGDLAFDPVDAWFVGQSLDGHLQGRVNNGTEVMLVLETVPPYMGIGQHVVAAPEGSDTTDPDSFTAHAEMCFQVAARYGSREVPDAIAFTLWWNNVYPNNSDYTQTLDWSGAGAQHPESNGGLKDYCDNLVDQVQALFPGVDVVISENGYDSDPASPQGAPAIGSKSSQAVQADWLVRSYLAIFASKINYLYQYQIDDAPGGGLFAASGLVAADNITPKISWYYTATVLDVLQNAVFESEISSGNSDVKIYRFRDISSDNAIYAIWCPTAAATVVNGYNLAVAGNVATTVNLVNLSTTGQRSTIAVSGGMVNLNVSETPVFVIVQ